jgi:hypothetical protein
MPVRARIDLVLDRDFFKNRPRRQGTFERFGGDAPI